MIVAVPREKRPGDCRVALTPAGVAALSARGVTCQVEAGAGFDAAFLDDAYREAGAEVVADRRTLLRSANVVLQVNAFGADRRDAAGDLDALQSGATVVGMADPLGAPTVAAEYASRNLTLFALELLPRISRAQSMDVLSSMATIAGYEAALLAAYESPRLFPMLMTAAGTLAPAKVFVIGAGVAGLQAIATARRLGAVVRAYDVRPAAREQIESVGATAVSFDTDSADTEDAGGYAKQATADEQQRQREQLAGVVAESDVVITTAAIPGREPPLLITAEAVAAMPPGSVIIDLAAERGGNCELTRPDETVCQGGVRVFGPTNLAAAAPQHASQMYSTNLVNFLAMLAPDGELSIDADDEVVRDTLVASGGDVCNDRVRALIEAAA